MSGVDVHFPCSLGDTVYYITGIHGKLIGEAIVEELRISRDHIAFGVYSKSNFFVLDPDEVYFTREAAKEAIKGGK